MHSFLIRRIRENGFRLFVRIPRLENEAYIGALPLYLHAIMARVPLSLLPAAEKLLNPVANFLLVVLAALFVLSARLPAGEGALLAIAAAALYAATPQFYHALSARNFGLSARSVGLILVSLAFFTSFLVEQDFADPLRWLALAVCCYLVIAFSTFAAQALILVGALAAIIADHVAILGGVLGGVIVFLFLHPRYGRGYVINTVRFIRAYASELAPVYVLARRPSLWRDLVWDIWARFGQGISTGFRYAYENSLLIVIALNPLSVLAAIAVVMGWHDDLHPLFRFACEIALAGVVAMLLTSFRATRFLGEPERYVEATAVFSTIGATSLLFAHGFQSLAWTLLAVFLAMDLAQLKASRILSNYLAAKPLDLGSAVREIGRTTDPLVACNNEQITKLLLTNDWRFSYCISVSHGYCGMRVGEAFAPFPFLRREAFARIVETYRVTVCVLDRDRYESVFDHPPIGLQAQRVIFESPSLRILALNWADPSADEV